jgi:hypothetical protein
VLIRKAQLFQRPQAAKGPGARDTIDLDHAPSS